MILFLIFLVVLFLGIPVAFAFGITGLLYLFQTGDLNPNNIITVTFGGMDSFLLMSIPFFIFAGDLMKNGGISSALIDFTRIFLRRSRGALGGVAVLASTFFGAITGSSAASVATIGSVMIPEMETRGYRKNYAASVVSASGFIGILIPPSVPLIIFGVSANVSISDLFLAGVLPGMMVAVIYMLVNYFITRNDKNIMRDEHMVSIWRKLLNALPGLFMPVLILGGIYAGIFTATEAAAIAVVYGMLVGRFFYRSFRFRDIPKIAVDSALTSATILIIIGFATFFGRLLTLYRIPDQLSQFMLGLTDNHLLLILLINVLLLFLGMFLETSAVILITAPILMPTIEFLGIDPVHFGIIMIFNLAIGLITPPMALNFFVASQISGVPFKDLIKPSLPYFYAALAMLIVVVSVPEISVWLPSLMK